MSVDHGAAPEVGAAGGDGRASARAARSMMKADAARGLGLTANVFVPMLQGRRQ